jgi:hypothetical protein
MGESLPSSDIPRFLRFMRNIMVVYAQPRPGNPTTATVITKAEIDQISTTEQSQRVRDENAKVVDIGDGWSMELGIIHRASTRNPPPALFRQPAPFSSWSD